MSELERAADREWRDDVTEKLSTLIAEMRGVKEQVTRQNGNVARLTARQADTEKDLAVLKASGEVERQTSDRWSKWRDRGIVAGLTIFGYMALAHGPELLKILKP